MKRFLMFVFALLITVSFVTAGFAQEKAKTPEKPAAAAPEKAAAAPEKPAAPEKAEKAEAPAKPKPKPKMGFEGSVTAIDLAAKEVTVKSKKDAVTFDLANAKLKGYKSVDMIKVGDKVAMKYIADGIKITKIGGKAAKADKPAKAKKSSFKDVDKNSDGKVTIEELVVVFVNVTPEQFKALDKNNDGALDESEYKAVK
jgi:hypothetical protein